MSSRAFRLALGAVMALAVIVTTFTSTSARQEISEAKGASVELQPDPSA